MVGFASDLFFFSFAVTFHVKHSFSKTFIIQPLARL
jgi:hypothetical protein